MWLPRRAGGGTPRTRRGRAASRRAPPGRARRRPPRRGRRGRSPPTTPRSRGGAGRRRASNAGCPRRRRSGDARRTCTQSVARRSVSSLRARCVLIAADPSDQAATLGPVKPAPAASDHDDVHIEVGEPKTWAAGLPGGDRDRPPGRRADGLAQGRPHPAAPQPARRLRLPRVRLARAAPHVPARVLRERGQGRRRGGHRPAGRPPAFFAEHSIASLAGETDYWLGQQGRLTTPMHRPPGATTTSRSTGTPRSPASARRSPRWRRRTAAVFYTSGRTSNEAAFVYQLFVRALGTNNLPDCSNMCHESSGVALGRDDRHRQGHGDARRHPRRRADPRRRPEPGHQPPADARRRWSRPSATARPSSRSTRCRRPGCWRSATRSASAACSAAAPRSPTCTCRSGSAPTWRCSSCSTAAWCTTTTPSTGRSSTRTATGSTSCAPTSTRSIPTPCSAATGLDRDAVDELYRRVAGRERIIICWAMGLTQHRQAVATIREIVNTLLLRGAIGKPGAGACPVRGHCNVQGDRTMGIFEKPPRGVARRARGALRLRAAARARLRHRRRDRGDAPRATSTCSSASAATSWPRRRTPT